MTLVILLQKKPKLLLLNLQREDFTFLPFVEKLFLIMGQEMSNSKAIAINFH